MFNLKVSTPDTVLLNIVKVAVLGASPEFTCHLHSACSAPDYSESTTEAAVEPPHLYAGFSASRTRPLILVFSANFRNSDSSPEV